MSRLIILLAFLTAPLVHASDTPDHDELTGMLEEFLAAADEKPAHERFWADELVYTSSTGARFGKADILGGFPAEPEPPVMDAPETNYGAEDVRIQQYDDVAVVAFRLVGTTSTRGMDPEVVYYLNTGTFLKRDGEWRVVAWQATKEPIDSADPEETGD